MKFSSLGFVAALALAVFGQPALAADAFKIDPKVQQQSMKDAPALVQQAGLDCQLSNAYLLGQSEDKVGGKSVKSNIYELACGPGLGYIFVSKPSGDPGLFDCLTLKNAADKAVAAKQKPGNTCQLPENKDPKQGLAPLLAKAKVPCASVSDGEWKGASGTDKINVYEAACSDGVGYLLTVPMPGSTKTLAAVDCTKDATVGVDCTLTSKTQIEQHIIKLSAGADRAGCMPTKARWVVTDPSNNNDYYEVGCADGKSSYMFQSDNKGSFKVIECIRATKIAGGCTYSNVDAGQTADIATYQKLAQQIKYPCMVSKYQSYGSAPDGSGRELVELACSDHPDGAAALVPTSAGQTGAYYNCVRAPSAVGLTCRLTQPQVVYSKISTQIAGRGKTTCQVDGARGIGKDDKGQDYVEVTCGSAPSLVLTYSRLPEETLISAVPCAQAPIANACTLKK
jgi:hypothetical protein